MGSAQRNAGERPLTRWACVGILAVAIALLAWRGLLYCLTAGRDDVFFSLWAGEQFAAGKGFVNYNHEPLEICSSMLHVIIIAAIALVAPDHVYFLNKLVGLAAASTVLVVVYLYRREFFRSTVPIIPFVLCAAALAVNNDFVYWAMGGLETPIVALLLTLYAGIVTRYWLHSSTTGLILFAVVQCLYVMARPEGFYVLLFSAIYVAFCFWFRGYSGSLLLAGIVPWLFFAMLTAFRWFTFRMLLPNPAYAKSGDLSDAVRDGASYILDYLSTSWLVLFQAALLTMLTAYYLYQIFRSREGAVERLRLVFLYGLCMTVFSFVLLSGGDWMGRARFIVPAMPILNVLTFSVLFSAADGIAALIKSPFRPAVYRAMAATICTLLIVSGAMESGFDVLTLSGLRKLRENPAKFRYIPVSQSFASWDGLDSRLILMSPTHQRESIRAAPVCDEIVPALYAKKGHVTIIAGQMGFFPYLLKKRFPQHDLYLIDLHGLATREIALMGLQRNIGGARGGDLAEIFAKRAGPLADFVLRHEPDVIFVHRLNDGEREAIENAGFIVLPGGNVAYRPVDGRGADGESVAADPPKERRRQRRAS
jgi:hypothetical protein